VYGEEAFGLACAEAALAKCRAAELPGAEHVVLDTLAWALFANGRDAEATRRSAEALAAAPAQEREKYRSLSQDLAKAIAAAADSLAAAEKQCARLTFTVSQQRASQVFLFQELCDLLDKFDKLRSNEKAAVEQRLSWARRIGELSRYHPNSRVTWAEARAAIAKADGVVASELYRDQEIELRDQDVIGLVPIGMNPATRLWEFYELRSAWDGESDPTALAIPRHDPKDGSIEVTGATGIVFVLLPGGTFTMGAQHSDPDQPNFDRNALDVEWAHAETLAPFFLARHELTRAQWQRLAGGDRPFYHQDDSRNYGDPVPIGPAHPAESVNWTEANLCMERHGLLLPTEAQWEYGCRAGTTTPWWTGSQAMTLAGAANILDRTAGSHETMFGTPEAFDDGFTLVCRVGSFRANAFGLFDVHGNVMEWCQDWIGNYALAARPGDGLRRARSSLGRVVRGGGYQVAAGNARSSYRIFGPPTDRYGYLGLRPARAARVEGR
jgi:formylglycine-generating enzyme required for sulfatase activity